MKKRIATFALALALCLSLVPTAFAAGFTDVKPGDYYYIPVLWAVEQGITSGTSASTFSPQDTCTIGQILTFLWRAAGQPDPSAANPFSDVAETDYYAPAARWASEKGLVSGTVLQPNAPCTRSMVVTYLWKLSDRPSAGSPDFTDVPANAEYAPAVAWAVKQGITSGTGSTTFSPQDTCTRGQIVTFLYRYSGSPETEPVAAYYTSYPNVPDFGAIALVPLMDSKVKENAHYFYYDSAEIAAKNPNRDFQTILSEYEEQLNDSGFSAFHAYTADEGPVAVYASNDTIFSMGVRTEDGVIAIKIMPISELAAGITSDDGKYYAACPGVPDFGAVTGVLPAEVSPRADGWTYTYNTANMSKDQFEKYSKLLANEGFVITDAGVNNVGMSFIQISKGGTNIIIVESGNSLMIAVYQ